MMCYLIFEDFIRFPFSITTFLVVSLSLARNMYFHGCLLA